MCIIKNWRQWWGGEAGCNFKSGKQGRTHEELELEGDLKKRQ